MTGILKDREEELVPGAAGIGWSWNHPLHSFRLYLAQHGGAESRPVGDPAGARPLPFLGHGFSYPQVRSVTGSRPHEAAQ